MIIKSYKNNLKEPTSLSIRLLGPQNTFLKPLMIPDEKISVAYIISDAFDTRKERIKFFSVEIKIDESYYSISSHHLEVVEWCLECIDRRENIVNQNMITKFPELFV